MFSKSFASYRRWQGLGGQAETLVIPDGFVWGAAVLGPIWAMMYGRWRAAAALGGGWAVAGLLSMMADPAGSALISLIVAYWAGMSARGLESLWLSDQGWRLEGLTVAHTIDQAESILIHADAKRADAVERRW